ncbi:hypothetical protein B0H13DRAFT_2238651 [Mycena leptocephala]|nr:hypothetical protein B0H13DRAFT_2238651 [Mycena leptocephala]
MIPINTALTKGLGLKTPIISAPMAAVTAAGGLGCIGAGFDSTTLLKSKIQTIRTALGIASGEPVPLAIRFIGWILDMTEPSDDPRLLAILDELPTAIWFAFSKDLGRYITQVHDHDKKHGRKTFIFVQVGSVASALRYAPECDCLVVQGNEAGGHGNSDAPPMFTLLQAVLRAVLSSPMIAAASGISSGRQIAALLTMGAAGVVVGTRFLLTPECEYAQEKKSVLLKAGLNATVRTLAYDDIMDDLNQGLSLEEHILKFDESRAKGEDSRLIIWAGVGVGLTSELKAAADVLHELHQETIHTLKSGARLVDTSVSSATS